MKHAAFAVVCSLTFGVAALSGQTGQGTGQMGQGQGTGQGSGRGQAPAPPTSVAAEVNGFYNTIAGYISRSAAMVPEEKFSYQPTPDVRSFARLFGHIVDDNNGACWSLGGLTAAPARLDQSATASTAAKMSKADLQKALDDSIALCKKAFEAVTPANMMEPAGRGSRTKIGSLIYNTSHINEHYGNLVTYLRLNGMVPPSSGGGGN
jgi:hypothetical protein